MTNHSCCSLIPAGEVDGFETTDTYVVNGIEVDKSDYLEHYSEVHAFADLFSDDEVAELAALEKDAVAVQTPKKTGVWYVDTKTESGHAISVYAMNAAGKTILWLAVDNDVEVTANDLGVEVSEGVTIHAIRVWNANYTTWLDTKGFAARYEHPDGTGTHIDGNTVRQYAMPRIWDWIAHFYGV